MWQELHGHKSIVIKLNLWNGNNNNNKRYTNVIRTRKETEFVYLTNKFDSEELIELGN